MKSPSSPRGVRAAVRTKATSTSVRSDIAGVSASRPLQLPSLSPVRNTEHATRVMDALARINREDGLTVLVNLHTLDTARAYGKRLAEVASRWNS